MKNLNFDMNPVIERLLKSSDRNDRKLAIELLTDEEIKSMVKPRRPREGIYYNIYFKLKDETTIYKLAEDGYINDTNWDHTNAQHLNHMNTFGEYYEKYYRETT